ncbi:PHP-associated domain-containing protein [Eubacteriales bacterium mix99]|jgi:hypothetical protein
MNYYRYDTHVHTSEVSPCGRVPAEEMVELYRKAGYQGILITDHYHDGVIEKQNGEWKEKMDDYLMGYRKAKEAGEAVGMDVMLGMELRFQSGLEDYLVYGFEEEFLYRNPYLNRLSLVSFRDLIREGDADILIFQAHPYRRKMHTAPPELLDGVEGFNGNPRHDSRNDKAFAFCLEHDLYLSSGSDAHQPEDVGRGGIGLTRRIRSARDYVELFRTGEPMDILFKR